MAEKLIDLKKPMDFKELLKPTNPYHWWGLILTLIGMVSGGVLGAIVAFLAGYAIIQIGQNDTISHPKKIALTLLITGIGVVIYFVIAFALGLGLVFFFGA